MHVGGHDAAPGCFARLFKGLMCQDGQCVGFFSSGASATPDPQLVLISQALHERLDGLTAKRVECVQKNSAHALAVLRLQGMEPILERGGAAAGNGRFSRQRVAISRLATPSSPVTAGGLPVRMASVKAISSARSGSSCPGM